MGSISFWPSDTRGLWFPYGVMRFPVSATLQATMGPEILLAHYSQDFSRASNVLIQSIRYDTEHPCLCGVDMFPSQSVALMWQLERPITETGVENNSAFVFAYRYSSPYGTSFDAQMRKMQLEARESDYSIVLCGHEANGRSKSYRYGESQQWGAIELDGKISPFLKSAGYLSYGKRDRWVRADIGGMFGQHEFPWRENFVPPWSDSVLPRGCHHWGMIRAFQRISPISGLGLQACGGLGVGTVPRRASGLDFALIGGVMTGVDLTIGIVRIQAGVNWQIAGEVGIGALVNQGWFNISTVDSKMTRPVYGNQLVGNYGNYVD
jgi:hypothetical protein